MSNIKKWSYGSLGNENTGTQTNPNTKGLDANGLPGVEGYIEEDDVIASIDNRPLINLAENDEIISANVSDVASEVDHGVFKNRYNEFEIEILPPDIVTDPDSGEKELLNSIRVKSGSSIINGSVTRIGSQKLIYFYRDNGSQLFPDYTENRLTIEIYDDDYFGDYKPVYAIVSEGLNEDFNEYKIQITNRDSADILNSEKTRIVPLYNVYRDWEDIVPYKAHNAVVSDEIINFENDGNFGQFSDGYWVSSGNTPGTNITNVEIKKDIIIKDKELNYNDITINNSSGLHEYELVTDGLFFNDVKWSASNDFDENADIQSIYIHENNDIYITQRSDNKKLLKLTAGSTILEPTSLTVGEDSTFFQNSVNIGLKQIDDYLFIYGTKGYIKIFNLTEERFSTTTLLKLTNFPVIDTEDIIDVMVWDQKIWFASTKSLWYTDYIGFNNETSTFTQIDLYGEILDYNSEHIVERIKNISRIKGNYLIDSSLVSNIFNKIQNPSIEFGALNGLPNEWNVGDDVDNNSIFLKRNGGFSGNYFGELITDIAANESHISQIIILDDDSTKYTLSAYLLANSIEDETIIFRVEELDNNDIVLNTLEYNDVVIKSTTTGDWDRYGRSFTLQNPLATKLKVSITSTLNYTYNKSLYIDNVQFETGLTMNQYVESFDYLFIGFRKIHTNKVDPPFVFINKNDAYNLHYTNNIYGEIPTINGAISSGNNSAIFITDNRLYNLQLLNNYGEYDGISCTSLDNNGSLDLYNNIARFETIKKINDRIFFGGTVKNEVIKVEADPTVPGNNLIEFLGVDIGKSLIDILGESTFIAPQSETKLAIRQFNTITELYENTNLVPDVLGRYVPGETYSLIIKFNNKETQIDIISPEKNNGPWTLAQINTKIFDAFNAIVGDKVEINILRIYDPLVVSPYYDEWVNPQSSLSIIDGFYSIGKNDITTHIRGDIHGICTQKGNDDSFFIIRNSQIFKTKYDPNIVNKGNGIYEYVDWKLYNEYSLKQYINNINVNEHNSLIIKFNDDVNNTSPIALPIKDGYDLLKGSLRIKSNSETEVGFLENRDYFVDYENKTIIRNSVENVLSNSDFNGNIGDWLFKTSVEPDTNSFLDVIVESSWFTTSKAITYRSLPSLTNDIYQIYEPSQLNVGDTYFFSIYVKSANNVSNYIQLTECNSTNVGIFDTIPILEQSKTEYIIDENNYNEWIRIDVSHTITNALSDRLRVEVRNTSTENLYLAKAQLEKNNQLTPWKKGIGATTIIPDMNIYLDYTEYRELTPDIDYVFDNENRKIIFNNWPSINEEFYSYFLSYKYEKIFSPYIFGNTLPVLASEPNDKDDYFLFELEGRIWAINQMFAMLSFDKDNPITISYNYHYPRIDQIKIRNVADKYGNYIYIVKGEYNNNNPQKPHDLGILEENDVDGWQVHVNGINTDEYIARLSNISESDDPDALNSEVIYEINVFSDNFYHNDIYNRRIYIDARDNLNYNISLYPETVAYFPFTQDFNSTNGLVPLNQLTQSKIVPIIKNYKILQNEEVGAWHKGYRINLRNKSDMLYPAGTFSIHVDSIDGNDINDGETIVKPVKTITRALELVTETKPNIIIISESSINENIEIDKPFLIKIFTQSFCYFRGNIQNLTNVNIQGVWFQHANIYPYADLGLYYNTFEASSINCIFPQNIDFYNSEFKNSTNSIVRVKDELFPSPFRHPYEAYPYRDDNIPQDPNNPSVATSDNESIAPGDSWYSPLMDPQPTGDFTFIRCLIYNSSDAVVQYDPEPNWFSKFSFDFCTIANNHNIFNTPKEGLDIQYTNSILYQNKDVRGSNTKIFNSNSDIGFNTCFIDFGVDESENYNYGSGQLLNRTTCIGKDIASNPDFVGFIANIFDYHLKSIARGYAVDSICTHIANGRDLGCYDEIREQTQQNIPKKLRSYVAYINEGIQYGIVLNSEKITVTMEFKPINVVTEPGILFDTRSNIKDTDYIVLTYNNNLLDNHSVTQDPNNSPENPYYFRVIVANKEKSYSILSPIAIITDEDFQKWHRISFTVNYEKIMNTKPGFSDKDSQQNIITFYHNDAISIESFIKYDLNRFIDGELIEGLGNNNTNAWDFNDISNYISIGSDFLGGNILSGYYTEFRIDNRFIDRKQFELWNVKEVPFNDPYTKVNQTSLARTLNLKLLNEYWSLKSTTSIGAKGNKFKDESFYNLIYDNGELTWALTGASNNLINESGFENVRNATIVSAPLDWSNPITFTSNWRLGIVTDTQTPRIPTDENINGGIILMISGTTVASQQELINALDAKFAALSNPTMITYRFLQNGSLEFYTKDFGPERYNSTPYNTIVQLHGDFFNDQGILNFVPTLGDKSYFGWKVKANLTEANIETKNIYTTKLKENTLHSPVSLIIEKQDGGVTSEDAIALYQEHQIINGLNYNYSIYIKYTEGLLTSNLIKFYVDEITTDFDVIEKYLGDWWKCTKVLNYESTEDHNIGIAVIEDANIIIDTVQLEERYFSGPYIKSLNQNNSRLIIPNSVLNRSKGVIFYKFKPLFSYYESDKKYLLEVLDKSEIEGLDPNLDYGFKIIYQFNETIGRGIITFSNNGDPNSEWKVEVIDRFWNQWHSIGIMYDFDKTQFSYIFDHQKITYDMGFSNIFNPSDIFIGSGWWGDVTRIDAKRSADIEIKNIIITNYPISDSEMTNWATAFEFYNESQINNEIIEHTSIIENLISQSNSSSVSVIDLTNRVEVNENNISNLGNQNLIFNNRITNNEGDISVNQGNIGQLEINMDTMEDYVYLGSGGVTDNSVTNKLEYMQDGGAGNWTMIDGKSTVAGGLGENLHDLRESISSFQSQITDVATASISGDLLIRSDLADATNPMLGAELIGLADSNNMFSGSTVKVILEEISGVGRTVETIKQNATDIIAIQLITGDIVNNMKDGNTGSWNTPLAQGSGYNIYDNRIAINGNAADIVTANIAIGDNETAINNEATNRTNADLLIRSDLAETTDIMLGASLIGINNPEGRYVATNVEAALMEIAGFGRNSTSMNVANNYNSIVAISGIGWTTETIKQNADDISDLIDNSANNLLLIKQVADGNDGSTWTDTSWNLVAHEGRIDTLESEMDIIQPIVSTNSMSIGTLNTNVSNNTTAISNEVTDRTNADTLIRSDLSIFNDPAKGAVRVGVYDGAGNFVNDNVETVLAELSDRLAALAGALSWQASVADVVSLPTSGNNLGDARTVMDDGDGKAAQYVWDGSQWIKVADIDWGNANSISFDNTVSELIATDVQTAIDELATRPPADVSKAEDETLIGDWIADSGSYYYDIVHELGTEDVVCMAIDPVTNLMIGVDEYERIDAITLRVWVSNPIALNFTVWGVVKAYSIVVNTWTPLGGRYYYDVHHKFLTKQLMISIFNVVTGDRLGLDDIEYLNDEVIRVWASTNTETINIYILKVSESSLAKDLVNWVADGQGYYESTISVTDRYDAIYEFFDISTMKNVGIDNINISGNILTVRKSNNTPLRMIILT